MKDQQTKIKLNLSLIFQESSENSLLSTELINSKTQRLQHSQSETLQPAKPQSHQFSTQKLTKTTSLSNNFNNKRKSFNINAQEQIMNLTKMIQQKQQIIPIKKIPKKNYIQIVERLYQPKIRPIRQRNSSKSLTQSKSQQKKRNRRKSLSNHSNSQLNIFQRLYRNASIKKIKQNIIHLNVKEEQQNNNNDSLSRKAVELSCSRRMQQYLNKSLQKIKYYNNNPQLVEGKVQKYFKPKLIPTSRYDKHYMSQLKAKQIADFMNSQESSFVSIDKSLQMINRLQDHFFKKMTFIFTNNKSEYIEINEQTVNFLTQVQFRILQPFIIWIQENKINRQQFQYYLRDYYNTIQMREKQQLRNHEIKTRNKYSKLRRQKLRDQINCKKSIVLNLQPIQEEQKPVSSLLFTVRSQVSLKYKGNHMDKILSV